MDKVAFPARLVVSRFGWQYTPPARVIVDPTPIESDGDLAAAVRFYRDLAENGGIPYTLELAALDDVARVVAEREAEHAALQSFGKSQAHALEPTPAPKPATALDLAYQAAQAAFADRPEMLARLDRALALVKAGKVQDLGSGEWAVEGQGQTYRVNGSCQCPDYSERGVSWCKHRLAVALVKKAEALGKSRAGSAANTPGPVAPEGTKTQPEYTTDDLQAQAAAIVAEAEHIAMAGPWVLAAVTVKTPERQFTVIDKALSFAITKTAERAGWKPDGRRWISPAAWAAFLDEVERDIRARRAGLRFASAINRGSR